MIEKKMELCKEIMQELLDNDFLNELDVDLEQLENDVTNIIYNKLKDYIIVAGRVLE